MAKKGCNTGAGRVTAANNAIQFEALVGKIQNKGNDLPAIDIVKKAIVNSVTTGHVSFLEDVLKTDLVVDMLSKDTDFSISKELSAFITKTEEAVASSDPYTDPFLDEDVIRRTGERSAPNVSEGFNQEYIDSLATNGESDDIFKKDYRDEYLSRLPSPFVGGGEDAHIRNFLNLYFRGRTSFFPAFYEKINATFRDVLIGTRMEPGQLIRQMKGPVDKIDVKFKGIVQAWQEEGKNIGKKKQADLDKAFSDDSAEALTLRNAYFAYIISTNIDLVLQSIVTGVSIQNAGDNKTTTLVDGLRITKEYSNDKAYQEFINADIYDSLYNVEHDSPEIFTEMLTSTDVIRTQDGEKHKVEKFFTVDGLEEPITYERFGDITKGFLDLDIIEDASYDRVANGDTFKITAEGLIRVTPPHVLTFNTEDKHRTGPVESMNGYDNDTAFIKFLVRSTPRLKQVTTTNGEVKLIQDTSTPYLTDSEYFTVSTVLSAVEDRTREGIAAYIMKELELGETTNSADKVMLRSIYYAYFHDGTYSYTPAGTTQSVKMASLNAIANSRNVTYNETTENLADKMMSTMVQFFSKQSLGRVFYKNGRLIKLLSAETNPIENILPDEITQYVLVDGELDKSIKLNHTIGYNQTDISFYVNIPNGSTISVKVAYTQDGPKVSLSADSLAYLTEGEGANLSKLMTALNMSSRLSARRFTDRLSLNAHATEEFVKHMVAYLGMNTNNVQTTLNEASSDALKELAKFYKKTSIHASLKVPIGEVAELYSSLYGMLSSTYEINGDGNSTARITNKDREGRVQEIIKKAKNKYSDFGIEHDDTNTNILEYVNVSFGKTNTNPVFGKIVRRVQKDGSEKNLTYFNNNDMTLKHRMSHLIEGGFLNSLAEKGKNTVSEILHQAMVYSDRSRIGLYSVEFKLDLKNSDAISTLKANYINTYRGRFAAMQFGVITNWSNFLLSPELHKDLGENQIKGAKKLGLELALITAEQSYSNNVLSTIAKKIHNLKIPFEIATKSNLVVRSTHVSNYKGYAMPETTGAIMLEYLSDDARALEFVDNNITKFKEVLSDSEMDYSKFTDDKARNDAREVFGQGVTFDEVLEAYHLISGPLGDSILDVTMTPAVEFGKNELMSELTMEGKPLTGVRFLDMLEERSKNYVKQSKRVQSQNSVGTNPETLREANFFRNKLPKNDLLITTGKGFNSITTYPPKDRFAAGLVAGLFSKFNGYALANGNAMITYGGSTLEVMFYKGNFEIANPDAKVYMDNIEDIEKIIDKLSALGIKKLPGVPSYNGDTTIQNSAENVTKIKKKLNNDDGEVGFGLDFTSNSILMDEDLAHGFMNILGAAGKDSSLKQDSFDGAQWGHPLYFLALSSSLGNQFSSFSTDGSAVKDLTQYRDPITGELIIQKKSTQNLFSNEILSRIGNEKMHNLFKIMNTSMAFGNGLSLQYRTANDKLKAKVFNSIEELEAFVKNQVLRNRHVKRAGRALAETAMLEEMLPDFEQYRGGAFNAGMTVRVPTVNPLTGEAVNGGALNTLKTFKNMQELWEYFASYHNANSWESVAEVLARNPSIRNKYVQKTGFTSAQKSGVKGLNGVDVLHDSKVEASAVVLSSVPNTDHMVMLQKFHSFDTSDSAEHKETLAVTSQFLSAMFFEGRTATEALNATAGQAMINNIRLTSFFRNIHKVINDPANTNLKRAESGLELGSGKRFSDLNPEEITLSVIGEFESLMEKAGGDFKKLLFTTVTTKWLKENIQLNRDSPAVIKMIKNLGNGGKSFNAAMLRSKSTDTARSMAYMDNVNLRLAGYSAVVSPADYLTTVYETPKGRLMRADAIEYILINGTEFEKNKVTVEEFLAKPDTLPTDKVKIEVKGGSKLVAAGQVHLYKDVKSVTYAILRRRSSDVLTGWAKTDKVLQKDDAYYEAAQKVTQTETRQETMTRLGIDTLAPQADDMYTRYIEYRMESELEHMSDIETEVGRRLIAQYAADMDFRDTFEYGTELADYGTFDEFKVFMNEETPDNSLGNRMLYLHEDNGTLLVSPVASANKVVVNTSNAIELVEDNSPVYNTDESIKSLLIMRAPLGQILTAANGNVELIKEAAADLGYDSVNMLDIEGNIIQAYPIDSDVIVPLDNSDDLVNKFSAWKKEKVEKFKEDEALGIKTYHKVTSNVISDKDFVIDADGNVVLAFYAKALFDAGVGPDFTGYTLYTATDEDLNWYKYYVTNYNNERSHLESTEQFQKYYIFNKDKKVYTKIYGEKVILEDIKKDIVGNEKEISERLRAELRILMEEGNIETDPVEVFAPNSNLSAFMMEETETLVSIAGYSNKDSDQIAHAEGVFLQKLRKAKKISAKYIQTPNNQAEYDKLVIYYKKKLAKGNTDDAHTSIATLALDSLERYAEEFKQRSGPEQIDFIKDLNRRLNLEVIAQEKIRANHMAKAFVRSLYIMPPRIPGQGKQAGYLAKIKGFIHSNKNAIYSPREAYFVTGKDNDIDTDNVLTYSIDKNGMIYDYSEYLLDDGAIMMSDGTNSKLERKLKRVAINLREDLIDAGFDDAVIEAKINKKLNKIVHHFENAVKNYIVDNMRDIMMDPINAVERETPVSFETLRKLSKKLNSELPEGLYNSSTHAINSYNSAWVPMLEHLNMQGKGAIADFANGQRTLAAVLAVQFGQDDTLQIGRGTNNTFSPADIAANSKHLAHVQSDGTLPAGVGLAITVKGETVIRDTFAGLENMNKEKLDFLGNDQAWEILSQLLSAATDNAKELILGKIGANSDTNTLIANMLVLGFDFNDIHAFLTQGPLMHIFETLKKSRDEYNKKSLRSIVTNIIKGRDAAFNRLAYDIDAVKELNDVINASEGLNDFRRILTLAQNNRIDTFDLHKVLTPVYRHEKLTPTDLLNGTSKLGDVAYSTGKNSSPVNSLYYIKKHPHARSLLASTNTAENIITAISDSDRILKDKMTANVQETQYPLSREAYDQTRDFIDEAMIEDFTRGKSVYLPLADNVVKEYDLSSQDQRNDFVYDIAVSVKYLKKKVTSNAFMDALTLRESRISGKSIVNIPYLKEKNSVERSILDQALLTLDEVNIAEDSIRLKALKDSLFYYALLTSKGKSTRHTILSMFEEQYVQFAEAITDGDILRKGGMLHSLIMQNTDHESNSRNSLFLKLLTPASLPKVTIYKGADNYIPEEFIEFAYDAMSQSIENQDDQEIDEDAYMHNNSYFSEEIDPLMDTKIKTPVKHQLFTVKHQALADSIYVKSTLSGKYQDIAVRLTRRNTTESIAFDTRMPADGQYTTLTGIDNSLAQDIFRAGYNIGMEVIIKVDADSEKATYGTLLAYLGNGIYLVTDENGTPMEMADVQLELLNTDKIFYGNNFGKAPKYKQTKKHARSYKLAKETKPQVINNREVVTVDGIIYAKQKKSSGFVSYVTEDISKDMIDYVFTGVTDATITTSEPLTLSMKPIEFLIAAAEHYNQVTNNQLVTAPNSAQSILFFLKTTLTTDDSIRSNRKLNFVKDWNTGFKIVSLESLAAKYTREINEGGNLVNESRVLAQMEAIVTSQSMEKVLNAVKGGEALTLIKTKSKRLFQSGMIFNENIIDYINTKIEDNIASCSKK